MFSQDRLSAGQGQGFCQNNPLPTSREGTRGSDDPTNPLVVPHAIRGTVIY